MTSEQIAALEFYAAGCRASAQAIMAALFEIEELRKDKARLDFIEAEVNEEPLLLHSGEVDTRGYRGLGLRPGCLRRNLREAIDGMKGDA